MSTSSRLTEVFNKSNEVSFDNNSKYIFFSDCHRGDNSKADNFAPNKDIYLKALEHYYSRGYSYIEIGDGDDLWENTHFSRIMKAHQEVYELLKKFHSEGRFYMIYGNHDIYKRSSNFIKKNLYEYYNSATDNFEPLLDGIKVHEGLILRYKDTPNKIFIVHGNQGEIINDTLWPIACFVTRHVWRRMELMRGRGKGGYRSAERMYRIKSNIINWISNNNQMIIAGHTHYVAFSHPGDPPYFNDGCCVYKGFITGIEIEKGEIKLVKWSRNEDRMGKSAIIHEIIAGPEKLDDFFKQL